MWRHRLAWKRLAWSSTVPLLRGRVVAGLRLLVAGPKQAVKEASALLLLWRRSGRLLLPYLRSL